MSMYGTPLSRETLLGYDAIARSGSLCEYLEIDGKQVLVPSTFVVTRADLEHAGLTDCDVPNLIVAEK